MIPEILLERHDGGAGWRCEGFAGVPVHDPVLISILSAECASAREHAAVLENAVAGMLQTLLAGATVDVPGPPCDECGHAVCLDGETPRRRTLLVLVGSADASCAFPPVWEKWKTKPDAVLPLFPRGRYAADALPPDIRKVNAAFWDHSVVELVQPVLAAAGVVAEDNRVFISYRRKDSLRLADQLFDRLSREGFEVFVDRFSVPPAVDFQERLTEELAHKSMIVLLESSGILESEWTRYEIDFATTHRLGLLALHFPDGKEAPGVDEAQRFRLDPADFRRGNPRGRLKVHALAAVVEAVKREHTRALLWRRDYLRNGLLEALREAGLATGGFGAGGILNVQASAGAARQDYAMYVTTRPPELPDFHVTHTRGDCRDPFPRGVIVGPDGHLLGERRKRLDWLAERSRVLYFDEGQMSRVAQAIARGEL